MGVIKLTMSTKAVQFITDEGVVYQTSKGAVEHLLASASASKIIPLTRMAEPISEFRFPKSLVWGVPTGAEDPTNQSKDALSASARKNKVEAVKYVDKEVL